MHRLLWYRDFHRLYGCHPLEGGFGRIKARKDRRSGMPLENPIAFYARYVRTEVRAAVSMLSTHLRLRRIMRRVWSDPARHAYRDIAITPPDKNELDLTIYSETRGTAAAMAKEKRQKEIIQAARSKKRAPVTLTAAE